MNTQDDYLYQAACFYRDKLENRRFGIRIARKKEQKCLELLFLPQHFCHLVGLHKLTDIPVCRRPSAIVYREILTRKITYQRIQNSAYISLMSDRLIYHAELFDILQVKSLFFRSLHGYFKGVQAECVMTKPIADSGRFGFLFLVRHQNIFFPCSFFTREEDKEYTKDGTRWEVVSVTEISKG